MRPIDAYAVNMQLVELYNRENDSVVKNALRNAMQVIADAPTIAPPPNAPLTLDELREMEWEPVWAESLANPDVRCWGYHCQNRVICSHGYCGFFLDDEYGKTWLAYRRKPEEVKT